MSDESPSPDTYHGCPLVWDPCITQGHDWREMETKLIRGDEFTFRECKRCRWVEVVHAEEDWHISRLRPGTESS